MCTSIIEIARAEGMAKRGDEWFPLTQSVVAYDHARHAPLGDVITLDFFNTDLEPGARAGGRADAGDGQGAARRARPGDCRRRVRGGGSAGQGRVLEPRSSCVNYGRGYCPAFEFFGAFADGAHLAASANARRDGIAMPGVEPKHLMVLVVD